MSNPIKTNRIPPVISYKTTMKLISSLFLIVIGGCALFTRVSSEEELQQLGVDETNFQSLPLCEQIRIYAEVGAHHLDRGHDTALMPVWVNKALTVAPKDQVADCIAVEGENFLQTLRDPGDEYEDASYAVHALVYKAVELDVFEYKKVKNFAYEAICGYDVKFPGALVSIYYVWEYGSFPDYLYDQDAIPRMREEICH
jgi:hypothetical protein